jgi:hypothetical protein
MTRRVNAVIQHWLGRLRRFVHTRLVLYVTEASTQDEKPEWFAGSGSEGLSADVPVTFRTGEERDLEAISELAGGRDLDEMRRWLGEGHAVYVVYDREKLVYYEWVAFHDFFDPYLKMTIPVKADECFAFDAFTHPDYKLKNILRAASSKIVLDCYRRHGKQKIRACVDSGKWPLYQKLYRITGLGEVRLVGEITRTRNFGIWKCHFREF